MALGSTIYNFDIALSDIDRGVYEQLVLRVSQHATETLDYMLTRVLAYCLEWQPRIEFGRGIGDNDDAAVWVRDYNGDIKVWIEVGMPSAELLHRASKAAERCVVYTHRRIDNVMQSLAGRNIYHAADIPIYTFDYGFMNQLVALVERRMAFDLSVTEQQIYLTIGEQNLHSAITPNAIPAQ